VPNFRPVIGEVRIIGPRLCAALLRGHPMVGLRHLLRKCEGSVWEHVAKGVAGSANGSGVNKLYEATTDISCDDMDTALTRRYVYGAITKCHETVESWLQNDKEYVRRANIKRGSYSGVANLYKDTQWLWGGWIPKGYLSMICGRPGIGKSMVGVWLATIVIKGGEFPDGSVHVVPDCMGTPEEHAASECDCPCIIWIDTEGTQPLLIERLKTLGTPMDRVFYVKGDDIDSDEFPNVDLSQEKWRDKVYDLAIDLRPDWICIDSLRGSHTGKEKDDTQMQSILSWSAAVTRDLGTAFTYTHHVRKSQPGEVEEISLDSVRGSSAIGAMMRSVIALDKPDPRDAKLRLHVIKSNLVKLPTACGLTLAESGGVPETSPTAPAPARVQTMTERAIEFLEARLSSGPRIADELYYEGKQVGIGERTLRVAKDKLGIIPLPRDKKNPKWRWALRSAPDPNLKPF